MFNTNENRPNDKKYIDDSQKKWLIIIVASTLLIFILTILVIFFTENKYTQQNDNLPKVKEVTKQK